MQKYVFGGQTCIQVLDQIMSDCKFSNTLNFLNFSVFKKQNKTKTEMITSVLEWCWDD